MAALLLSLRNGSEAISRSIFFPRNCLLSQSFSTSHLSYLSFNIHQSNQSLTNCFHPYQITNRSFPAFLSSKSLIQCVHNISKRDLSTSKENNTVRSNVCYIGVHTNRLRRLRLISILSSSAAILGLPLAIWFSGSEMSVLLKIGISTTVILSSVSSTALMHIVTLPYIIKLEDITTSNNTNQNSENSDNSSISSKSIYSNQPRAIKRYRATRLNIYSTESTSEFSSDEIKRQSVHPFANFEANGKWYFIDASQINDRIIQEKLL